MIKFTVLYFLIFPVALTLQDNYDVIQVVSNFFTLRHVQTITAATCWSSEVNERLLKILSAVDKSLSFNLFESHTHDTWYRHGFLVDLSCNRSLKFMHKISDDKVFDLQNDWVLFNRKLISKTDDATAETASDVFNTYLGKSYVLPDSCVFLFQEVENSVWEIWSGFRASKLDAIRVFKIGTTAEDHTVRIDDLIAPRTNFRGVELKATTVILHPDRFYGFDKVMAPGLDVYSYMHYPMIQLLARQLNFNFSMTIANDYGWLDGNGSFSGLTGILQREESDFGAVGSLMRIDRMAAVDYTVGTVSLESNILLKQPKSSSITNIHVRPFTYGVWLMVLFTSIGFVAIIAFLNKFKTNRDRSLTILDVIGLVHGAVCQQGSTNTLDEISLKVIVFVLFLTSSFLFTAYSATIVSLFQLIYVSIKDVEDFSHEKSLTMSIQISPFAKPFFDESTDPILRKIYDMKIRPYNENDVYTNVSKGIERIRTEFHGFMVEKTSAYQAINEKWREEEKCGLSEIQILKLPVLAIPVIKKSGHKDVFKQKLIQQQEVGIRRRLTDKLTPQKPTCISTKTNGNYVSVTVREIFPTLKLFGYGVIISSIIFLMELAYHTIYVHSKTFKWLYKKCIGLKGGKTN